MLLHFEYTRLKFPRFNQKFKHYSPQDQYGLNG